MKQVSSFWREKYPETLHPVFNKKNVADCVELIVNNAFQFQKNYMQILGTPLGTKMALTNATLILALLEKFSM